MKKIKLTDKEMVVFKTANQQKLAILGLLQSIGKAEQKTWGNISKKYIGNFDNAYIEVETCSLVLPWEEELK